MLFTQVFPTGFAALTTDEDFDLFIVAEPIWGSDLKIRAGNPINIRIQSSMTETATVVSDNGLVPFFPLMIPNAAANPQFWGHSGIMFYISRDQPIE